jgi:hypothetical protein
MMAACASFARWNSLPDMVVLDFYFRAAVYVSQLFNKKVDTA